MYPLLRRAADVAVHSLRLAPNQPLSDSLAHWVDAHLGDKSDPVAKRVRGLLAMYLARELLLAGHVTDVGREGYAGVVDDVTNRLTSDCMPTSNAELEDAHRVWDTLDRTEDGPAANMVREAVSIALGQSGAVFNLALTVSMHLAERGDSAESCHTWWTNWLTDTLDQAYRDAIRALAPQRRLSMYFCATENHVIAPDYDMNITLEGDALHLVALGTQFDLRRPACIKAYHGPPGPIGIGGHLMTNALRAADSVTVPVIPTLIEDWQLKRPVPIQTLAATGWFARRPRRDPSVPASMLVPSHPHNRTILRSEIRGGILNAKPAGAMVPRLVVQLDLGQGRPLRFTIFGLREMWAGLWILHRWLGNALAIDATWTNQGWQFLDREN